MSKYGLPGLTVILVGVMTWRLIAVTATPDVRFILSEPRVAHLQCGRCADTLESTLKRLGVDTKRTEHQSHTDVRYECRQWRVAVVDARSNADDWRRWLRDKGFATGQ